MTLVESYPSSSFEAPVASSPFARFQDATIALDELSALHSFGHEQYGQVETAKNEILQAIGEFEHRGNHVAVLRARTALAFADLTARRGEFIARRHEDRFAASFRELFIDPAYVAAGLVAHDSLELHDSDYYRTRNRREIRGFMSELTGLMVTLAGDNTRFGVPSSVYDDRESSGFHFDMMVYDLARPHDIRRAADMKTAPIPAENLQTSRFARQISADAALHNGPDSTFWDRDDQRTGISFLTLRAAIGEPMTEPPHIVRQKLTQIHDDFFDQLFTQAQ